MQTCKLYCEYSRLPGFIFRDEAPAIPGNIVGAQVGLSGIPAKYTENLELRDLITEVADDLWHDCRTGGDGSGPDPVWKQKYMDISYGRA